MISIIVVNYHVKKELFACIQSIYDSKPKNAFEIIVVDNDEVKTIQKDLHKKFPQVVYLPNINRGFGQGNNVGAKQAKGEYLFFLNPDTKLLNNCIDSLVNCIIGKKQVGIVAPVLYHSNQKPFALQGLGKLTPLTAIFSLSFINKFFPKNPISRNYWNIDWDKKSIKEVDAVPGTAFLISKKLFKKLHGFDEHFFLYFEETDLCKRVSEMGLKLIMYPCAKVYHAWEQSTKKSSKNISKIMIQSRFYYLKKHFGLKQALLTEAILRIDKYFVILILILCIASFLRFYRLNSLMPFIGDQGWFYISARDMLLTGNVPLVGIASSHPWLHQGALWTYLLAGVLWIFRFNPLSGAYVTATLGVFTVWLVYKVGEMMFSKRVGLIAALIYATSPEIIISDRLAYHTSPIPTLTLLLLYILYRWIKGSRYSLPIILFLLALLYNFELATIMFIPILGLVTIYGLMKKTAWVNVFFDKKLLFLSALGLIIPMIPMLLYDSHHGFPQTFKFAIWILYKIVVIFGFPQIHPLSLGESYNTMLPFASKILQLLIYFNDAGVAWLVLGASLGNLFLLTYQYIKKAKGEQYFILLLFIVVPTVFYIAEKTNSDAYWTIFYTPIVLMIALLFDRVMKFSKMFYPLSIVLFVLVFFNILGIIQSNYLNGKNDITFSDRIAASQKIIKLSGGKEYNLIGVGHSSQYESFTKGYEYLTWWLGHGPSNTSQKVRIDISEPLTKIVVQ